MRVMLLVTDLERGGAPQRLARIARLLRDTGHTPLVGCLAHPGPISAELEADGLTTFACGARAPRDAPAAFARLVRHIRILRPDLIHATLVHANVAARLAGLWTGTPVVTSTATIEVERHWHRWAERLTARLDAGQVVNGSAIAQHVQRSFGVPATRIFVVPPLMGPQKPEQERSAARAALGLAGHEFVVAWSGRFDRVKRLHIVVKVAEMLTSPPTRFLIAGEGPLSDEIERLAATGSAARRIEFLNWLPDVSQLLVAADALIFPSLTEGMPNTVLEAMAAGLPVVASDIPALRELRGDDQRLVLVDSDEPGAFADALRQLALNPTLRAEVGARAAAFAARFADTSIVARRLGQIYRNVVARSRADKR